ncbi:beta-1,3-galactosyltransferase 4-like [Penaeus indicus]|uniref:beta-1,3-galactosyltransferase 4-like n=1 Tax=Penaeus indicus TaxID=29960 RepID=UPI00300CD1B9
MAWRSAGAGEVIAAAATLAGLYLTLGVVWEAEQSALPPPPTTHADVPRHRAPPMRSYPGLYPPPAPLLDLPAYSFVANSPACGTEAEPLLLIILVFSHPAHATLREAHRAAASWEILQKLGTRRVFLLADGSGDAQSGYASVPVAEVVAESGRFRDLVVADFRDHYRNLTYKHALALTWASSFCSRAKYILKMDDDMMVDLWGLVAMLREGLVANSKGVVTSGEDIRKQSAFRGAESGNAVVDNERAARRGWKMAPGEQKLLSPAGVWAAGLVQRGLAPQRNHGKWHVSLEEYPKRLYPTFLSGWAYVITQPAAAAIMAAARDHALPFWIDDVYMTGILAATAGVARYALNQHYSLVTEAASCCLEGPAHRQPERSVLPLCGLLVAPSDKNTSLLAHWMKTARACHLGRTCPSPPPSSCPPTRPHYAVGTVIPLS